MAGDNIGALNRLRSFARYWHAGSTAEPWQDHLFTAFPQNENLSGYSLEHNDYFYLYNYQRSGTVPVYRHYRHTKPSNVSVAFNGSMHVQATGTGARWISFSYSYNDNPGYRGKAINWFRFPIQIAWAQPNDAAGNGPQIFYQSGSSGSGTIGPFLVSTTGGSQWPQPNTGQFYNQGLWNTQISFNYSWVAHSTWLCFRDGHGSDCNMVVYLNALGQEPYEVHDHWLSTAADESQWGYTNEGIAGYIWPSDGPDRKALYGYWNSEQDDHHIRDTYGGTTVGGLWNYYGIIGYAPTETYGCTDQGATNWDNDADFNTSPNNCNYVVVGCMDPNANNYNPNANTPGTCTYNTPTLSYTLSPSQILAGSPVTATWSTNYGVSGVIQPGSYAIPSSQLSYGTKTYYPTSTTSYVITISGHGGTSATDSKTVTVWTAPDVTIAANGNQSGIAINRGQSFVLSWWTNGDGTTATIDNGVGSVPFTSQQTISPTQTITYTISVNLTVSGTNIVANDSDQVTITVYQPPTASLTGPENVDFNQTISLNWSQTNGVSVLLQKQYTLLDGGLINQDVTLTGSSGTYVDTPYNNGGRQVAREVNYVLTSTGAGGLTASATHQCGIDVDQMPDLVQIPPSEDKDMDEEPVISPDIEVTTDEIEIDDLDVPVEITANQPLKVQIDDDGVWHSVRET